MSPKKGATLVLKGTPEQIDSSDSWDEDARRSARFKRIRKRVPTGHPQLAKTLLAMRRELEPSAPSEGRRKRGEENERGEEDHDGRGGSDNWRPGSRRKEKEVEEPKRRKGQKRAPKRLAEEESSEEGYDERSHVSLKTPPVAGKKRSAERRREAASSSGGSSESSGEEDRESAKRVMPKNSALKGALKNSAQKARTPSTMSDSRKKSTVHSESSEELEDSESATASSSSSEEEEAPVRVVSKATVNPMTRGPARKSGSSRRGAKDLKFGDAKAVDDSDSSGSWADNVRHRERFNRIRKRIPTGHPGLAHKAEKMRVSAAL